MNKDNQNNDFKTPEGYFESFTERLMGRLSDNPSAHNDLIPKKDGFEVPEGYFEGVNQKIIEKLNHSETKVVQLKPFKKYYMAAAAVAAIVTLAFIFNWSASKELSFDNIADSDLENYFENTDLGLSTYELAELIPVDELEYSDMLEGHLDQENVLDYLNDNIDDFEALNLENNE